MKKLIYTVLTLLFMQSYNVFAQDIDLNEVNISYIRLPLNPIEKSTKNYQVTVEQKDASKNEQIKAQYEIDKEDAEKDFKVRMETYEAYQKRQAEKSVGKTITDNLFKSKEEVQQLPIKKMVPPPVYINLPDNSSIEGKINLVGYTKTPQNAVKVTITFLGFECSDPVYKSVVSGSDTYWTYSGTYKNPVNVKVEYNGKIYVDEVVANTNTMVSFTNDEKARSQDDAIVKFKNQKSGLMTRSTNQNVEKVNEMLNSKCGYSPLKHEALLFLVKSKKVDYADYASAYTEMNEGFLMLSEDMMIADGKKKIASAAAKLEEIMKLYEPENKKARINEEVAIATYFNFIECYMWVNDYMNVQKYVLKLKTSKLSNREERRLERIKPFVAEQKERYEANK